MAHRFAGVGESHLPSSHDVGSVDGSVDPSSAQPTADRNTRMVNRRTSVVIQTLDAAAMPVLPTPSRVHGYRRNFGMHELRGQEANPAASALIAAHDVNDDHAPIAVFNPHPSSGIQLRISVI